MMPVTTARINEALHVVDDGRAENDARFIALRPAEILEHARRDADARGGERRAEEDVRVDAGVRQEPRADAPAEEERADDAKRRDEKRRAADLEHLRDRRLEADLEEQEDRAELRQRVESRVALERFEARESRERQIAEQDAGAKLSEHRRLAKPRREVPADLGGREDERQREDQGREGVAVHVGLVRAYRFSRSTRPAGRSSRLTARSGGRSRDR